MKADAPKVAARQKSRAEHGGFRIEDTIWVKSEAFSLEAGRHASRPHWVAV
jgi:hypothetical protein